MRLPRLLILLSAGLLLAPPARAQEVKYWPLNKISFPVDLGEFNKLNPKPVSILFYSAPVGGKFSLVFNRKPSELDEIIDTKDPSATPRRGFTYPATADGEEEFAVQYEYADGTRTPTKLTPQYRIKFDTRPPSVKAAATGSNSIRWLVEDPNLVRESIRVEGRYVGNEKWEPLNTGELNADDSFKWDVPANKTLEVRVYARDRAGHENRSLPIKLAGGGGKFDDRVKASGGGAPAPPTGSFGDPVKTPVVGKTGFGGLDDQLPNNRPKIEYVNTNKLRVTSKVTHITRSGVKAAQLFALEPTSGADWKAAGKKENLTINQESPDAERLVSIDYDAPRDGLYGFVLQPISGAGTKLDDPRAGDTPQYLVYVDTTQPEFRFVNVNVLGGGLSGGPMVEIQWDAKDTGSGFHPEPILLEYSEDGQKWKAITAKTANTGRYTWEITDKKLWKFFVRGQASDMAGNTKLLTYSDDKNTPIPILVDLDKPSGNVDKVNPNGPATVPSGPRGISSDGPGVAGGGVTAIPQDPPGRMPVVPVNNPKPADPQPVKPGITPVPPVTPGPGSPPIPTLPKDEPKKNEPKKPGDPKKIDAEMPIELPPMGQPITIPPPLPAAQPDVPAVPVTLPTIPPPPPPGGGM